jgi:hypothetical protein
VTERAAGDRFDPEVDFILLIEVGGIGGLKVWGEDHPPG